MPTYVYETCPSEPETKPVRFEVSQRMTEKPLTRHPDTGEKVRRVISGGLGFVCGSDGNDSGGGGSCSGPGCGHTHH
jgi:predicted nucleic acid-binding Zn ribbon protein